MKRKLRLIVLFPRDCVNCKSHAGSTECDYKCPICGGNFCSHCYKTDPEGDGTFVFCPHCETKLYFPVKPKSAPEFKVGDICIFTNGGSSGFTGNDGRRCEILRIKDFWVNQTIPEYHIRFLESDTSYGVSEHELQFPPDREDIAIVPNENEEK